MEDRMFEENKKKARYPKKLIITIEDDLHAKIKIICAIRGITLREYVTFAVKSLVDRENLTVS